jgi:hypothetical protein
MNRLRVLEEKQLEPLAVSITECSKILGISKRGVWYFIKNRRLVARRFGKRTVVLTSSMRNFAKKDHPVPRDRSQDKTPTE